MLEFETLWYGQSRKAEAWPTLCYFGPQSGCDVSWSCVSVGVELVDWTGRVGEMKGGLTSWPYEGARADVVSRTLYSGSQRIRDTTARVRAVQ